MIETFREEIRKRGVFPYCWILCELINNNNIYSNEYCKVYLTKSDIEMLKKLLKKIEKQANFPILKENAKNKLEEK